MKVEKRFLCTIALMSLMCGSAIAEPDFNPAVLNPAGTINTHDMDVLKKFEMEKQEEKDFQNYKENNEKKEKVKKEKKIKAKVEKAAISEYATKGVYIENIAISPSKILTEEELREIIEDYTQTNLTFEKYKKL